MRDFLLDPGFMLSAAIILNIVGGYWCWDVLTRQKRADNMFLRELEARRRPRRQAYQEDKGEDDNRFNRFHNINGYDITGHGLHNPLYGSCILTQNPTRLGVDD